MTDRLANETAHFSFPHRMASWWIRWSDLEWPLPQIEDDIKHRADAMAKNGASHAIIFGAHFRWDFMPLWGVLHDMMRFISDELHVRGIRLYDHHSATLTHRYDGRDDMIAMRYRNRHHVTFAPSRQVADAMSFLGMRMNEWRMVDVISGGVANPGYTAEIFCINNNDYVNSYTEYLSKLISDTGIDGIEVDDGLFYPRLYSCGCHYCRDMFRRECNSELPLGDDLSFWGNWDNPLFRGWIAMRHRSVSRFMSTVRDSLPLGFPLMACCSGSFDSAANETSCSYENFISGCNSVMLEMCGNTPSANGDIIHGLAAQLHHIAIAKKNRCPCIGLGYGHCADEAGVVWAFNKWLGCGTWFSTLKGRLGLRDRDSDKILDDHDLIRMPFLFEERNPDLFKGEHSARVAILYSRATRDYYGGYMADYANDYMLSCKIIFEGGIDADVILDFPLPGDPYDVIFIPSAVCLSDLDINRMLSWIDSGGSIVASGPLGFRDDRGERRESSVLNDFGIQSALPDVVRPPKFPHDTWEARVPAECVGSNEWMEVGGRGFVWNSQRVARLGVEILSVIRRFLRDVDVRILGADGWYVRKFLAGDGVVFFHVISARYAVVINEDVNKLRYYDNGMKIVSRVSSVGCSRKIFFEFLRPVVSAEVIAPLFDERRALLASERTEIMIPDGCYYFIVRVVFSGG